MGSRRKVKDDASLEVERVLGEAFDEVEAYRQNPVAIRVRVVDQRFHGMSTGERIKEALTAAEELSPRIKTDITMLLLLAPDECDDSPANIEFEDPSPSCL